MGVKYCCWWLKSCTTWDLWNYIKNLDQLPTSTGEFTGFLNHQYEPWPTHLVGAKPCFQGLLGSRAAKRRNLFRWDHAVKMSGRKLQGFRSIFGRKLFIKLFFTSLAILKWISSNRERRQFGEIVNSSFRYLLEAKTDAQALHPVRHCFSIKFGKTWKVNYHFHALLCFATKCKGCSYDIALQRSPRNKSTLFLHQKKAMASSRKYQGVPLVFWLLGITWWLWIPQGASCFFCAFQGESQNEVWMEGSAFSIQQVSQMVRAQNPDVRSKG